MTISRRTYDWLTFPWRLMEAMITLSRIEKPAYYWATTCQVFWLLVGYWLGWFFVPFFFAMMLCALIMTPLALLLVLPIRKFGNWLEGLNFSCKKITWKEDLKK